MNYMLQKKLNNKGYMLVEIIIASVLAFSVTYYLLNLTYEFKDKNEDVYFSTAILSDKINITKNIMNDLEGKSVSILSYNNSSNPLYVELVVGDAEGSSIKRISIDKNTNTITYGMYNQYREKYIVTDDNTYYQKEIDSFLEFGEIKLEGNLTRANSDYVYIIIPISNIYSDETYDIRLLVRTDIKLGGQKYRIQINLENTGTPNNVTSQIYLNYNDGVYLDEHLSASKKMTTSSNPVIKPTRTGYTFGGYYTGTGGSGTQLINKNGYITSNFTNTYFNSLSTLYVKWEATPYNISYNYNGGTNPGNPATYNTNTNTFTLKNPTKIGYTFKGWTGSNGNTPQTSVSISKGSTGNKRYTANWTRNFTCASKGGTTTYMGKQWYTVENNSNYCELVLNSTVGSSSGNTYNASTGTGSGSVYSYIKNYSNGINTIAQERSAGLINSIDADISKLRSNMPKISNSNNLYWVTNQMIYSHNPVYDYRISYRNYYVSGGSDDRLITEYNSSQMQRHEAPVLVSSRIDNEGLIYVRNYSPNIKNYDVKTYRERHTYDYGSIYYSDIYIRFQNNKYNKYFEVQYNNSSSNKLSSLNQFQQVNFYSCGSYGLPKHAEKIFAFKFYNSSFNYSWNNSGWERISKYYSSSTNRIKLQFAATLSEDDFADGNFHFENSNDCKELVDYEIYGEPKPIYYRPHIKVKK